MLAIVVEGEIDETEGSDDGERRSSRARGRAAHAPRPLPAGGPGPHRHQRRLRDQPVRRLHRAGRRQGDQVVHAARAAGRRPVGHDHRRPGDQRQAPPAAAVVLGQPRSAVRLLHAGDDPRLGGAPLRQPASVRGRDPRGPQGQPLPLHRLPQHHQVGEGRRRARPRGRSRSMPGIIGSSIKRREDPALITGRGKYTDDFKMPGHAARRDRAQPACARAHQEHRHQGRARGRQAWSRSTPRTTSRRPGCPG